MKITATIFPAQLDLQKVSVMLKVPSMPRKFPRKFPWQTTLQRQILKITLSVIVLASTSAFVLSNSALAATPEPKNPPAIITPSSTPAPLTGTIPAGKITTADKMKALLGQGKAAEAYALGLQFADEFGDPAFDFYFGVASLDSGHAAEGVLALERYVLNFPDSSHARLELARGYFILGEDNRAREEFNAILKTSPPPTVRANITRFLDAIRSRESRFKTTAGAFVEAGLGYDTNVNGGVSNAEIVLPIFGFTTLTSGVKTDDNFSYLATGGQVTHPLAPGMSLFGAANIDTRMYFKEDIFNQLNMAGSGGLSYLMGKSLFRGSMTYATTNVDDKRFRDVIGAGGEWNYQLNELQALNVGAQYAQFQYADANQIRNSNYTALSLGYRKAIISNFQPLLQGTFTLAQEDNNNPLGAVHNDLSRDIYGLRLGVSLTPASKWSLNSGISYQNSAYQGVDALLITREDNFLSFDAALSYAIAKNLVVKSELLVANNASNNPLNEYQRESITFKVRYEFQ